MKKGHSTLKRSKLRICAVPGTAPSGAVRKTTSNRGGMMRIIGEEQKLKESKLDHCYIKENSTQIPSEISSQKNNKYSSLTQ